MPMMRRPIAVFASVVVIAGADAWPGAASRHPSVLFTSADVAGIRARAAHPTLAPVAARLFARAETLLKAAPILVSTTGRGEPDPPGYIKGLDAARRLQGRVLTYAMAFVLNGDTRYRNAAVAELDRAISQWPIWVDTAHTPPYDLMAGEISLTFGLAWDWLYDALSPAERDRLREGVERRAMAPYLAATMTAKPMSWYSANHNWNPVCNGGAAVLALALGSESALSADVLRLAAAGMNAYWNHLGDDGGWDEGTGYWTYGHRYAFMAADALRRAGYREGATYLDRPGARATGYFPLVFNPGRTVSASFSDSSGRAADALFYFLARENRNPDFAWFQDRVTPRSLTSEGWPDEALTLVWRPVDESWLPEASSSFRPLIPAVTSFPSIGWAMLADSQPDPQRFLAFKNGSLAANHSHLDLNHISVGVGETMLLVDLGSRSYPADYFSSARYGYYEITTAGHNSVLVGGKGQSVNKVGQLRGPVVGSTFVSYTGVADNAYDVSTPRARRHVVFVDERYFVLLDEVAPASPATVELRFHTYGTLTPRPRGGWVVAQNGVFCDIVPASGTSFTSSIEVPSGWIKPVNVLRLTAPAAAQTLAATVLIPRPQSAGAVPLVSQEQQGAELRVTVGGDVIVFRQGSDGYAISTVTLANGRRGQVR
jgi:hypothetical protein